MSPRKVDSTTDLRVSDGKAHHPVRAEDRDKEEARTE